MNPNPVQSITGTSTNSFNFIEDAITKAYEIGASKKSASVTILLKAGTHYMSKGRSTFYKPTATDKNQ